MNIGNKIKSARLAKGYTQEELGQMLGVQKSAIAKYENGRVINIKRSTLKKISDILGIKPSDLIFEDIAQPQLSQQKQEFIKRVESMSDEQLDILEKLLDVVENKG